MQQIRHREQQTRLDRRERYYVAKRYAISFVDDEQTTDQPDEGRCHGEERLHNYEEAAPGHVLLDRQLGQSDVRCLKLLQLLLLTPECLGNDHARDEQSLARLRCQICQRTLSLGSQPTPTLTHELRQIREQRHRDNRHYRQLPGKHQHGDKRGKYHGDTGQDVDDSVRQHQLSAGNVVRQTRLHVTSLRVGEERQRLLQQVLVHGMAHLLHHLEADRRVQLRLREVESANYGCDSHHAADEPEQVPSVAVRQGIIDHLLYQYRCHRTQRRCQHDQNDHRGQSNAMRGIELDSTAQDIALGARIATRLSVLHR